MLQPNPENNKRISEQTVSAVELKNRPPLSPSLRPERRQLAMLALRRHEVDDSGLDWLVQYGSSHETMTYLDELIEDGDPAVLLARAAVRFQLELRF